MRTLFKSGKLRKRVKGLYSQGVACGAFKGKHRMVLVAIVIFSLLVSGLAFSDLGTEHVYAYTAVKGIVTCSSGMVRKDPSTASACVFCVSKDNELAIISEKTGKDGKVWYQVAAGDAVGYIRSDLIKKTTTKIETNIQPAQNEENVIDTSKTSTTVEKTEVSGNVMTGKIKGTSVRIRDKASINGNIAGVLFNGATVTVIGKESADDKDWYKVQCTYQNNAITGYVCADYVETTEVVKNETKPESENTENNENQKTTASNAVGTVKGYGVNVRKSPVDGESICKLNNGAQIAAIDQETGSDGKIWYKISFTYNMTAQSGYIRSDFVDGVVFESKPTENKEEKKDEPNQSTTSSSSSEGVIVKPGAVRGINVNIRKEAVTGEIICKLSTGHSVYVNATEKGSDGKDWHRIYFTYNNATVEGYIRSDFVTVEEGKTITLHRKGEEQEEKKEEEKEEKQEEKEESEERDSNIKSGSIKGYGVRIRETAVNGAVVAQLDAGHPLDIESETDGSDGYKWYKVNFSYLGNEKTGYIRSDFVNVVTTVTSHAEVSDEDFEESISELPESYKNNLRVLHENYPHWIFQPVNTNLDWNDAVNAECSVGKNLVSKKSVSSWKSTEPQAYNWTDNSWYGFDGGSWASASRELIMYYMDPRNFLDDNGIFQFETLEYEDYQNEAGVESVLEQSFMAGSYTDTDGATRSYASTFVEAGKEAGISPYHLAARCLQEQGMYGLSQSVLGNVSGYENLFNFFNIGAYAANGRTATINGLIYASGSDDENMRPWNSRYRSIMGSAKHVSEKYVKRGQNTLYFQKFNVVNTENGVYSHQYMTNILAASSESARMRKAYTELDTTLVFKIPYYNNMPDEVCQKPTSDSSPNNYLSSLWVEGYSLSPEFSSIIDTYYLIVDHDVSEINIGAEAVADTSSIGGTGEQSLEVGTNNISVVCKAQNGNTKTYTIIVQRNE